MNFRPIGNRVLIEAFEQNMTKTGIILPDNILDKPLEGIVVAVGSKVDEDIIVGDIVVYGKYSGTEITINDKKYLIMMTSDVFGVK